MKKKEKYFYNFFINLGQKGYQKLKLGLELNQFKTMSDVCGEVIGFLFRELLNELVEHALEVRNRRIVETKSSRLTNELTSNDIFETYRLYSNDTNNVNTRKRYSFL